MSPEDLSKKKEEAVEKLDKFMMSVSDWLTQVAAPELIMKVPDAWIPPNENGDDVAFLLLDLRDPFARRLRSILKESVDGIMASDAPWNESSASLFVGQRSSIERVWRTFRSEKPGELGSFPGWMPCDLPLVVISSGAIAQIPFGQPRN